MKYVLYFLLAVAVVSAVAGGIHLYRVSVRNKKEMAQYEGAAVALTKKFPKTLVVYYGEHETDCANHSKENRRRHLRNQDGRRYGRQRKSDDASSDSRSAQIRQVSRIGGGNARFFKIRNDFCRRSRLVVHDCDAGVIVFGKGGLWRKGCCSFLDSGKQLRNVF